MPLLVLALTMIILGAYFIITSILTWFGVQLGDQDIEDAKISQCYAMGGKPIEKLTVGSSTVTKRLAECIK